MKGRIVGFGAIIGIVALLCYFISLYGGKGTSSNDETSYIYHRHRFHNFHNFFRIHSSYHNSHSSHHSYHHSHH